MYVNSASVTCDIIQKRHLKVIRPPGELATCPELCTIWLERYRKKKTWSWPWKDAERKRDDMVQRQSIEIMMNAQKSSLALADRGPEDSSQRSPQVGAWFVCPAYWPYLSLLSMSCAFALGPNLCSWDPRAFAFEVPFAKNVLPWSYLSQDQFLLTITSQVKYPFPQQTLIILTEGSLPAQSSDSLSHHRVFISSCPL